MHYSGDSGVLILDFKGMVDSEVYPLKLSRLMCPNTLSLNCSQKLPRTNDRAKRNTKLIQKNYWAKKEFIVGIIRYL